jgi:hypothetical protein
MAKKLERIYRKGPITAAEANEDAEIRRQVQAEFPPIERGGNRLSTDESRTKISGLLKRCIRDSGKSVEMIARESGLSELLIRSFLAGERDIHVATADKLAESLGLNLTATS